MTRDRIQLLNVSTEVESGILTKTSSATYHLLVDCEALDLLGRVLATVSSQKNSVLAAISWQYEDIDKTKIELVETAVRTSKETAAMIANSLDVPLLGVHKLSYEISGLDNEQRVPEVYAYATRSRKAKSSALESLDLSHTATVLATVTAEFMIDKFTQTDRSGN